MMNRISRLTLGVALALGCGHAAAMGLGPIEVRSGLNQPLVADIPILADGESIEALKAQLASPEDLRRVGIDASSLTVPLYFEVIEDSRGRPIIRVTSSAPVREPYISFLVEANWGKGRLLREYSVLLDPPVFAPAVVERVAPASPAPIVTAPRPSEPVVAPRPATPAPATPAPGASRPQVATQPVAPAAAPTPAAPPPSSTPSSAPTQSRSDNYTVEEGDALYNIASDRRPDSSVSINQMMVAMLRANPSAFYKDNINALKKGAVLRIPDAASARELSAAAAAAEVASQVRAWSGADDATLVADAGTSTKPSIPAATTAGKPPVKSDARLALVPPKAGSKSQSGSTRAGTAGGTGAAEATEIRGELARTREQLSSREQEAVELRSRVKDLEKIGGESKRLIELKSNEIAALKRQLDDQEKRLADSQQAAAAARAAAVKAGIAATAPTPAPAFTAATPVKVPATGIGAAPAVSGATNGTRTAGTPTAGTPTAGTPTGGNPTGGTPTAGTPTGAVELEGAKLPAIDPMAGTALAADVDDPAVDSLPVAVIDPVSEPTTTLASPDPASDIESAADAPVAVAATDDAPARAERPWYLNPLYLAIGLITLAALGLLALFGRRRPPEVRDVVELERPSVANEFASGVLPSGPSPVAVGGGTLAVPMVGNDVLERALLDRRAGDPENLEHHLDVLRHYHELGDRDHFVAAASNMRDHVTDSSHYAWLEAQELGRDLDPANALFASDAYASMEDFGGAGQPGTATDYDFHPSSNEPPTPVGYQAAVAPASSPPIDLGDEDWDQPRPSPVALNSPGNDPYALDRPSVDTPTLDEPELTHYQFDELPDAPRSASAPVLGEDAVATKLDLARAYIDMGDSDGARAMLQEVLSEGSGVQRDEAKRLIDGLS